MPRTLLVSWGLPPALDGSSVSIDYLSRQFGPEELLLAGMGESSPGRGGLPPIIRVSRNWSWPPRGRRFVHPPLRWATVPVLAARIAGIARENDVGRILAVFPDEYHLCAALRAARSLRLPFVPWLHNTFSDNRTGLVRRIAQRVEGALFAPGKLVLVANDGMRAHFASRFPEARVETLPLPFGDAPPEGEPPPPPADPPRFALLGNINASNSDAAERLVRAACELGATPHLYSGQSRSTLAISGGDTLKNLPLQPLPYDAVVPTLRQADILLLPHGLTGRLSAVEYATIFPTRTVQYLVAGRPIVANAPPDSFLARWLIEHDCAEVVTDNSQDRIVAALRTALNDTGRRASLVAAAAAAVADRHAPRVASRLLALLDEVAPAGDRGQ